MKKLLLISTISLALLTGCAMKSSHMGADNMMSLDDTINQAQMQYNKAHKQMVAWGKTKSILTQAKKLKDSDAKKSMILAQEALYQANTALAQSDEFEKTWRSVVPQ